MSVDIRIEEPHFPAEREAILSLIYAYTESLGFELSFQNFDDEISQFPGKYGPSEGGAFLVARRHSTNHESEIVGTVGLCRNPGTWCEMKRLYVSSAGRGSGIGEKLLEAIIHRAREMGYEGIRLDTLPSMKAALQLYRKYGFEEIEPYYFTPIEGTVFMGLRL